MGKVKENVCRIMKTICSCFSVAARQAREAEVNAPSRRRFRLMDASGDASFATHQVADTDLQEGMGYVRIGLRTFLNCLTDANRQAEQSEKDVLARRSYRVSPEGVGGNAERNDIAHHTVEICEAPSSEEEGIGLVEG